MGLIKKHVDRAKRSNEPSTTARQTTTDDDRHHRDPTNRKYSLAGFLLLPFWDRKRVMVILRKTNMWISCETMIAPKATPQRSLEDSTDKSDHRSSERWGVAKGVQKAVDQLFKHCIKDPWISFCNPSELLWRKVVLNLSTSHIQPLIS